MPFCWFCHEAAQYIKIAKNRLKLNISPYGENFDYFIEINFEIWKVTFLESILPLRNYGMDFRSSGNNETSLAEKTCSVLTPVHRNWSLSCNTSVEYFIGFTNPLG